MDTNKVLGWLAFVGWVLALSAIVVLAHYAAKAAVFEAENKCLRKDADPLTVDFHTVWVKKGVLL